MRYKCVIVDDEPLAAEIIKRHIEKFDTLQLIGICADSFEAINFLGRNKTDLLFLDIHMPGMKGTEMLKCLANPPRVILTTAYREYALEGYELNVLDYLLKPISFDRFMQAINKFIAAQPVTEAEVSFCAGSRGDDGYIYARDKNLVHKIKIREISYVESCGDYITIYSEKKKITIRNTITGIEKMLDGNGFIRIHRSYIINLDHINTFTSYSISVAEKDLPIGPVFKCAVFKALNYEKFKDMN